MTIAGKDEELGGHATAASLYASVQAPREESSFDKNGKGRDLVQPFHRHHDLKTGMEDFFTEHLEGFSMPFTADLAWINSSITQYKRLASRQVLETTSEVN